VHLGRQLRRELQPLGITATQAALLHTIKTTPGVGIRELATIEGMSRPATTTAIDRLQRAGLVLRTPSREDGRRVELEVTPAGRRVLRSARTRRTAWLAARLKRLEPSELRALADAVGPLRRLLEVSG
jgi:DNA-binding MarR family transcriptional regulator